MNRQDLRAQLPNFEVYGDWRRPDPIESIIVHHSGPGTVDASGLPTLSLTEMARAHVHDEGRAHVSYHYAIDRDGTVFYLLDEAIAGYHAFLPAPPASDAAARQRWQREWLNGQWFNRRSVGILLLGWFAENRQSEGRPLPDHATAPSPAQWQALVDLLRDIRQRHAVPLERVEGHREALQRAGFGSTSCPGPLLDLDALRAAVAGQAPRQEAAGQTPRSEAVAAGPVSVAGGAPPLQFPVNRPLIGLHARNDHLFTPVDWQIIQQARVESLKLMSFTREEVYAQARAINPQLEFIVRLYPGGSGRGHVPPPLQFADQFRALIERLHQQFGVLKFEIHNEPNHPTGLEGWGDSPEDARAFQAWYRETFAILRQRHPWALLGYPGLAVPHRDLEWLEWNREAIETSDWLGVHVYWQTPPDHPATFQEDFWGRRYQRYHARYPHKLLEITEFGNSNGQSPPLSLPREEQARQYVAWLRHLLTAPFVGSAHGFIATSPDATWASQGFTWGDDGGAFPVASAIGALPRPPRRPEWYYAFTAQVPKSLPPDTPLTFPVALGNGGRLPWLREGVARTTVSAKWVDANDRVIEPGAWALLPHDMAPADRAEFRMTLPTPGEPGSYRLRLALFHNGHNRWLHQLDPRTAPDFFPVQIEGRQLAIQAPKPSLAASYTPIAVPDGGRAGETLTAEVEVTNEGTRRWETRGAEQGSIHLGSHWVNAQGQRTEGARRGDLPGPVGPGERARLQVPLIVPSEPGAYTLQLALVSELERWFDQQLERPFRVVAPSSGHRARYGADPPATMQAGERQSLALQLTNSGSLPWATEGPDAVQIVQQWLNAQGQPVQPAPPVPLPQPVPPGSTVTVNLPLVAPAQPGAYRLRVDLTEGGNRFFSQQGNAPLTRSVTVSAPPPTSGWGAQWLEVKVPPQVATGQRSQIGVRLRNTGQQPWPRERVRVAYRLGDGLPQRVAMPADVPPGGETALGLPFEPGEAGTHALTLDLWEEGRGWRNVAAPPQTVTVSGGGARGVGEGEGRRGISPLLRALLDDEATRAAPPAARGAATASDNAEWASFALDSSRMTAWSSGRPQRPGMWFQVDLGRVQPVRGLRAASHPEQFPRGYTLEGSEDGETWSELHRVAENWSDVVVALSEPRPLRFLRLTQTNASPWHPWSIRALHVEG